MKANLQLDGEQENALEKSVKTSFKFINKGGIIDIHINGETEEESEEEEGESEKKPTLIERQELIRITREIRGIEERVKLIGCGSFAATFVNS